MHVSGFIIEIKYMGVRFEVEDQKATKGWWINIIDFVCQKYSKTIG